MYRLLARLLIPITFALAFTLVGASCNSATSPELRVLGVDNNASPHQVVFVQVTNPAHQTMRLTRLEYKFAAQGATVSTGELALQRDVPSGAAVVVEVPLDRQAAATPSPGMMLEGKLTAQLDQIERIFQVSAQIRPH